MRLTGTGLTAVLAVVPDIVNLSCANESLVCPLRAVQRHRRTGPLAKQRILVVVPCIQIDAVPCKRIAEAQGNRVLNGRVSRLRGRAGMFYEVGRIHLHAAVVNSHTTGEVVGLVGLKRIGLLPLVAGSESLAVCHGGSDVYLLFSSERSISKVYIFETEYFVHVRSRRSGSGSRNRNVLRLVANSPIYVREGGNQLLQTVINLYIAFKTGDKVVECQVGPLAPCVVNQTRCTCVVLYIEVRFLGKGHC